MILRLLALISFGGCIVESIAAPSSAIEFQVGQTGVRLAEYKSRWFRISLDLEGPATPITTTTFLSPGVETLSEMSIADELATIKSKFGTIRVSTKTGQWTLLDPSGKAVAKGGLVLSNKDGGMMLEIETPDGSEFLAYGTGNRSPGLVQSRSSTGMIGGVSGLPQYWSTSGYSAFAVTTDDNAPADWERLEESSKIRWTLRGSRLDLYLAPAPDLKEASRAYAALTGYPPVPPRWSFGYLQSRWGWKDRVDVQEVLQTFREKKLPVDAFLYDFEWYAAEPDYLLPPEGSADFTDFRWNPVLFPQGGKEVAEDKADGLHTVLIRKPRMGNAETLRMMRENDWIVSYERQGLSQEPDGSLNHPPRRVLDLQNEAARQWYTGQLIPLARAGVAGWWNDEGEATYTTYYYWNLAEIAAQDQAAPNQRFWSLNRCFSPGLQRLGAGMWTGDIETGWASLAATPQSLLNLSLAGIPYSTCDNGGFIGGDPSPECFTRWMQMSVFFPWMRSHGEHRLTPRLPWLYGPKAEEGIRHALETRYRLLPYLYSLAHEAMATGLPLMRPMIMEYPRDARFATMSDQWFVGGSLLATPILTEENRRTVQLPRGLWYRFDARASAGIQGGGEISAVVPLDQTAAFVRAGSILTLAPIIPSTSHLPGGPLEVQVYPGRDATFVLVEDDGATKDYLNGKVRRTTFQWKDSERTLKWSSSGNYDGTSAFHSARITVMDTGETKGGNLKQPGEVRLPQPPVNNQ